MELINIDNVVDIDFPNGVSDYEGNMQFDPIVITFQNRDEIQVSRYTGLWELEFYDILDEDAQESTLSAFAEWLIDRLMY